MTVNLDSGKIAEVTTEQARFVDHAHVLDKLKNIRAERVIMTGESLAQQTLQGEFKGEIPLYTNSPQQDFFSTKEIASHELPQPFEQQDDLRHR